MPSYRLIFPTPEGTAIENTETVTIDSGDEIYEVGAEIEHDGKLWRVSQAPVEDPALGETVDLMVWPVD
jgi:hypothetical protein